MDIKDGVTKLSFHYELSGATATDYIIYGVVLHEQEAEIEKEGGKLLLSLNIIKNNKFNNYIKFNIIIKIK